MKRSQANAPDRDAAEETDDYAIERIIRGSLTATEIEGFDKMSRRNKETERIQATETAGSRKRAAVPVRDSPYLEEAAEVTRYYLDPSNADEYPANSSMLSRGEDYPARVKHMLEVSIPNEKRNRNQENESMLEKRRQKVAREASILMGNNGTDVVDERLPAPEPFDNPPEYSEGPFKRMANTRAVQLELSREYIDMQIVTIVEEIENWTSAMVKVQTENQLETLFEENDRLEEMESCFVLSQRLQSFNQVLEADHSLDPETIHLWRGGEEAMSVDGQVIDRHPWIAERIHRQFPEIPPTSYRVNVICIDYPIDEKGIFALRLLFSVLVDDLHNCKQSLPPTLGTSRRSKLLTTARDIDRLTELLRTPQYGQFDMEYADFTYTMRSERSLLERIKLHPLAMYFTSAPPDEIQKRVDETIRKEFVIQELEKL